MEKIRKVVYDKESEIVIKRKEIGRILESKGTILIVDDEPRIRRMVSDYLKLNGYDVIEAGDGEEGEDIFYQKSIDIDLILLDVMMPKKDGYSLLKDIRKLSSHIPVIMLTAKGEERDQLDYFKDGADDFIGKPFSLPLLLAHVEAIKKRCFHGGQTIIRAGEIEVEPEQRHVKVSSEKVELTPKEYDLLLYFIENEGIVLERDSILNSVWGFQYVGDIRTVDTHVKQLRAKLEQWGAYIRTVHGIGYRFEVEHVSVD